MAITSAQVTSVINQPAVSLLFHEGQRPVAADIAAFARESGEFTVSFDPSEAGESEHAQASWLELLANGLTFDVTGFPPDVSEPVLKPRQSLSLGSLGDSPLEAITIRSGPHLSSMAGVLPIMRTLTGLAGKLSQLEGVKAVNWHPARSWCEPAIFRQGIENWIEGGVFPGLLLVSLAPVPDGGFQSEGLSVLTGQELRLEPELVADKAAGAKLALRLLDFLVVHGRITAPDRIMGPDGHPLRLEQSDNGLFVRVWSG